MNKEFENSNICKYRHHFHYINRQGEKNTWWVILLTVFMMVIEIIAGIAYGSMALLADGWHMGTHAFALGITAFAYYYSRKHLYDPNYSFGTGKIGVLGGYTSAIVLGLVAFFMLVESVKRFILPVQIRLNEAILVAVIGLIINVLSALLLRGGSQNKYAHDHFHEDHNLRAAYLHVITDALTSVLAIIALFTCKLFGWFWMDPIMVILGSILICKWSYSLLLDTSKILLDSGVDEKYISLIRSKIESDSNNVITDLHVWYLDSHHKAAIISINSNLDRNVDHYKNLLEGIKGLVHVTIEINKKDFPKRDPN